jgi:urease accessory protein
MPTDPLRARLAPLGSGLLEVEVTRGRSVVTRSFARAPLRLLDPRNGGDAVWVFASTLGGGLVDGDELRLDVRVRRGARAVIGTQASTKVYRSPRAGCRQDLTVHVADEGLLVAAPDHVTCFAGASYDQTTAIHLAPTASLVLVDTLSAGRVARGERWMFNRFTSRLAVDCSGAPVLRDAIVLDPAHGDLAARLGRFDAIATLVFLGPAARSILPSERPRSPPARRADLVEATSPLQGGAIVRLAGASLEAVLARICTLLAGLAGLLGDDLFARKP